MQVRPSHLMGLHRKFASGPTHPVAGLSRFDRNGGRQVTTAATAAPINPSRVIDTELRAEAEKSYLAVIP